MTFSLELGPAMTPDKSKKPLPSSISLVFPEQPSTYQQWRVALQLVKSLYVRGQWKHCAARCCQLLTEAGSPLLSIHATYLHFYCALCNEVMARLAHPLSSSKIQSLERAKASYETAASTLPATERTLDLLGTYEDDSWSTQSSDSTESEILDYYQSSPRASSSHNDASSFSSVSSSQGIGTLESPFLRTQNPYSMDDRDDCLIFSTPEESNSTSPPPSRCTSIPSQAPTSNWLHICSLERYNADLFSCATMFMNHISSIETLIQSTREAQAMKYFAKRLASHGEDDTAKAADVSARIARLKANGWRKERFRPERYRELCECALEELRTTRMV